MPNYLAHLTFGRRVLAALPVELRAALPLAYFDLGQLGSDPLFFYPLPGRSSVSREGHALHHASAAPVLERLRDGSPEARAYAAGYLCHFLLDAACHPYIYETASRRGISHMAMEGEFDRYLRADARTPAVPPLWPQDEAVLRVAASAYATTDTEKFTCALREFVRFSAMLDRLAGTKRGAAVNLFTRGSFWSRDLILRATPHPLAATTNREIEARYLAAVEPAARAVAAFLAACESGAPLEIPACDHAGRPLGD